MSTNNGYYQRFSIYERLEHITILLSFTTLAVTGLPQKFPEAGISLFIASLLGGIESIRSIHHFAATILMIGLVYHLAAVGYKVFVQRVHMSMLPGFQDVKDAVQAFLYNIGIGKYRPQMGRFTFEEKAEYWALVWGTVIMAITGFMMWNPISTTRFLPGQVIPAAKAAHGAEAILAVLAIIVWHMYGVHLKRFNKAMWTGKISEEQMLEDHPLELADLKAESMLPRPDTAALKKRRNIYLPIALLVSLGLLAGIYAFVTVETTSITTLPPPPQGADQPVYVPQTQTPTVAPSGTPTLAAGTLPPNMTSPAGGAATWNSSVGPLFQQKCLGCHGATATAGLNLSTYANALKGSSSGPVIVPNDSAGSKLVKVQSAGGHPGQLTPQEIAMIIAWIDAGALEK